MWRCLPRHYGCRNVSARTSSCSRGPFPQRVQGCNLPGILRDMERQRPDQQAGTVPQALRFLAHPVKDNPGQATGADLPQRLRSYIFIG
jgi:hypothetical protein